MKKFLIPGLLLFGLLLAGISILFYLSFQINTVQKVEFEISTKPVDNLWDFENRVDQLQRIPNTPYIMISFTNPLVGYETVINNRIVLIDTEISQCILDINYNIKNQPKREWMNNHTYINWFFFLNQEQMPIFRASVYFSDDIPEIRYYLSNRIYYRYFTNRSYHELFFAMDGKKLELNIPPYSFSIPGKNLFIGRKDDETLTEYSWKNNEAVSSFAWDYPKDQYGMPSQIISFNNGYYLNYDYRNESYYIISKHQPSPLLSFTTLEMPLINSVFNQGKLMPLSFGYSNEPNLVYMDITASSQNIYEINESHIETGGVEDIFSIVGEGIQMLPQFTLNQNRVLAAFIWRNKHILQISERKLDKNGTWQMFEPVPIEIELPKLTDTVSKYPYNDTHILMYGSNALWTIKYDGTELQQIFPKVD